MFNRYTVKVIIRALGKIGAAKLQRQMTFETISNILPLQQQNISIEIRYTGCGERKMRRWLVALRRPFAIFDGIDWWTSSVLKQPLELARQNNLAVHLLEELTDLDTPGDLERLDYAQPVQPPYLSVIIPTLNEAENIEKAIRSAQAEGVEIIVVDGNSCDETVLLAQKSGVKVLTSPSLSEKMSFSPWEVFPRFP